MRGPRGSPKKVQSDAMYKQMVSFTEPQMAFLKDEAKRLGIPVAELVRRIIDQYRERLDK